MTTEQRVFEFQSLATLFNKRYAPADWKKEALGLDLQQLGPWLTRVRAARSDNEFFEISAQYVAHFKDGHSAYRLPSTFRANLGISIDLYDGKPLVEFVDRGRYPVLDFDFRVGDELVSLDGVPVNRLMDELEAQSGFGTPRGSRRNAAALLTQRAQIVLPRAVELPDQVRAVFRRESGEERAYQLTWLKSGSPYLGVGPLPNLQNASKSRAAMLEELKRFVAGRKNWAVEEQDLAQRTYELTDEEGRSVTKSYVLGFGARRPYYDLPANFVVRRGEASSDYLFTGTYEAEGQRIGYIRIPNFPTATNMVVSQIDAEITYLKANTDGLVIDVSRNTGGGCLGMTLASKLIPNRYWFFGEQLRPTLSMITSFQQTIELAGLLGLSAEDVAKYQAELDQLLAAYRKNRGMTDSIPACSFDFENEPWTNRMTGEVMSYDKPLIVLVDDFSVSFGDIFPAMIQDNLRGKVVGYRTGGLGGAVTVHAAGQLSESSSSVTVSLVVRRQLVSAPNLPVAPLIENIGVVPDIELDYMTRENLNTRGKAFVDAFTKIIVAEILAKK